jgi:RNA polymerase sigma factor (TIGR02999 family)
MTRVPSIEPPDGSSATDSESVTSRDEAFALLYAELKRCAARHLRRKSREQTLETTALVHEVYCRLYEQRTDVWQSAEHFMALASTAMRRVLIDHARARLAGKRGEGWERAPFDVEALISDQQSEELVALDEALVELSALDERQALLVELRFFGGYSIDESARVLGVSAATAKREWTMARAWLHQQIQLKLGRDEQSGNDGRGILATSESGVRPAERY